MLSEEHPASIASARCADQLSETLWFAPRAASGTASPTAPAVLCLCGAAGTNLVVPATLQSPEVQRLWGLSRCQGSELHSLTLISLEFELDPVSCLKMGVHCLWVMSDHGCSLSQLWLCFSGRDHTTDTAQGKPAWGQALT